MSQLMHAGQRAMIVQQLQRDYGNGYVQRLVEHISETRGAAVQPKLTVGPASDKYEQEADRIAKQVMETVSSPSQEAAQRQAPQEDQLELQAKPLVQRQALEEEELQMKPLAQRVITEGSADDARWLERKELAKIFVLVEEISYEVCRNRDVLTAEVKAAFDKEDAKYRPKDVYSFLYPFMEQLKGKQVQAYAIRALGKKWVQTELSDLQGNQIYRFGRTTITVKSVIAFLEPVIRQGNLDDFFEGELNLQDPVSLLESKLRSLGKPFART